MTDMTVLDETTTRTSIETPQPAPTPTEEVKTGVNDFAAALNFVKSGVERLGAAAENELVMLAKKYL